MNKMLLKENGGNKNDTKNNVSNGKNIIKSVALAGLLANGVNTSNSGELVTDLIIDTGIKYANIDLHNVKGDYLLSGYTDGNGKVIIPKTDLVNSLQQNGFNYTDIGLNNVILNVSVNTDPGGYGSSMNTDMLSDYGKLSSAGRIKDLNNSVINNTTTLVEKLVYGEWYGNIREFLGDFWYYNNRSLDLSLSSDTQKLNSFVNKSISRVISGLDQTYSLTDTNSDGVVNRTDIYNGVQEKLKQIMLDTGYSEGIKYGDYNKTQLLERNLKRNTNFVIKELRLESGVVVVRLDGITEGSYVEFSGNSDFSNKFDAYPDDDLYLYEGYIMHIRERFSDNTLGKVNILKVVGNNVYRDDKIVSTINNDGILVNAGGISNATEISTDTGNTGGANTNTGGTTNTGATGGTNTGSTGSTGGGSGLNTDTGGNTTGNITDTSEVFSDLETDIGTIGTLLSDTISDDYLVYADYTLDTTGYTSDMLLLSQQIEQLKTSISSSKNAQTNYYNNIDDFTRILLDPNSTLQQRQLAINTIISNTNSTSTINVLNKTYNDLPDKTIIDTSILELQNKQILFPQVKQQWYDKYKNFEQEYLQKKQDYDSYMVYISNYGEILKEYNYVFNQIQSLGILPNLKMNIGSIVENFGVQSTIDKLKANYNTYSNPSYNTYVRDTLTRGLPTSTFMDLIQVPGEKYTYKMTYGSNLSFPAVLQLNFNGVVQPAIQINNTTHRDDILAHTKRTTEYNYTLRLLNLLKGPESSKKHIESIIQGNIIKFTEMKNMKENYFLIPKNEYEIALSNYNSVLNAESRIETVKGRLTRYKMYVDDVLNNINSMHIKNELLTNLVRNINNLVASTNIIISDSYGLPNKITNKYKSNQIRSYINGEKYQSKSYNQYPFTSFAIYNRLGAKLDYPALIWVEYKSNPNDTYLYSTERIEVRNEYHKQEIFKKLHESVKVRIDLAKSNLTLTELTKYYTNIQIATNNGVWGDGFVREDLQGLSKEAITSRIDFFAGLLFEYNLKNDANFKNAFNAEVTSQTNIGISQQELILGRPLTQAEKTNITNEAIRGVKDGIIRATRDYLMQYIDLVGNLTTLTYSDVSNGIKGIWSKISNPLNTLNQLGSTMITFKNDMLISLKQLLGMGLYEKSVGGSYVGTTLGLVAGDPGTKLRNAIGDSNISNVSKKVIGTLNKLQESYRLKVIAKYKNINGVDDIASISRGSLVVAGNGGGAITIYGNQNTADSIINVLKSKGWKEKVNINPLVKVYESSDGMESINMRTVSSSEQIFINDGYNVNVTIDLMKKVKNDMVKNDEIKFLTPKN